MHPFVVCLLASNNQHMFPIISLRFSQNFFLSFSAECYRKENGSLAPLSGRHPVVRIFNNLTITHCLPLFPPLGGLEPILAQWAEAVSVLHSLYTWNTVNRLAQKWALDWSDTARSVLERKMFRATVPCRTLLLFLRSSSWSRLCGGHHPSPAGQPTNWCSCWTVIWAVSSLCPCAKRNTQ